jgi:2-succinyl-6-hydroxy-2,4-cyclohexadiene-1-carboxylate synthase
MTSHRLESWDGVSLRVHVAGSGPAVVVLHGFTGSAGAMQTLSSQLATAQHTVISLDLLGHGESGAPRDQSRYTIGALERDLDAVLEQLELSAPALVGYSLGGRLALSYACSRPRRLSRVVAIGAALGIEDLDARRARAAQDEDLARSIEAEGVEAFVDHWMEHPLVADQATRGSAAWEEARARRLANSPAGLTGMLRGFGQGVMPALAPRLAELSVPVLFVVGGEDAKYLDEARRASDIAPHGRLAVVPDAGHAPHLAAPVATAALILGFLAAGGQQ